MSDNSLAVTVKHDVRIMTPDTSNQSDEDLLAPRSNNDLEYHLFSSVRNYVFSNFAATRPSLKVVSYYSS
jgi:hypothetical protein